MRYDLNNSTLALIPKIAFKLDTLLADRVLDVNDHKLEFRSAHLTVQTLDVKNPNCLNVDFARMVLNIPPSLIALNNAEELIRKAIPEALRENVRDVTVYKTQSLALIYFTEGLGDKDEFEEFRTLTVKGNVMDVAKVCVLADAHPSSSQNEIRLSRFKV